MLDLLAARAQMGTSLAFHIVFSVLGVGLPLLLCISEGLALKTKKTTWMMLTRRWARATAILFAIGAVSGTILTFELGLLWPSYTEFVGRVIGLPFMLEGFAFFTEAIFLGLYLYGWDQLSPRAHWLCSFPIWIAGSVSAWFIVVANSWMNTPAGFVFRDGQVVDVNPWHAMFNPSTPYETVHMLLASYVCTGFAVAAVYAFSILRGNRGEYQRKGLMLGLIMGSIAIPLQVISGDLNARFLSAAQPTKFAAMEAVFKTQDGAPILIGGLVDQENGVVHYAFEIPKGLSLLTLYDPNATVTGLDQFPPSDWPNVQWTHLSFDLMVGSAFFILFVALVFFGLFFLKKRTIPLHKPLLWGVVLSGFLSFVALEAGWMVTELGRQPWTIYNYLRTSEAVTTAPFLTVSFVMFTIVYILLATALIWLLLRVVRRPLPQVRMVGDRYEVKEPASEEPETVGV